MGYLAQHDFLDQVQELRDDIFIPDFCHVSSGEGDDEEIDCIFQPYLLHWTFVGKKGPEAGPLN